MTLKFSKDKLVPIKDLLNENKYPVDFNYQREPGAWTVEDERYFIDSLLKNIQIPKIYLHRKRNKYYIIDGQQRIETIRFFVKGRVLNRKRKFLKLTTDITGRSKDIAFNDLNKREKVKLLNFKIASSLITSGNDNDIRDLFRRLQRGKPLTEGEKLNSMKGNIVKLMRKITEHDFFKKSLMTKDKRHKFYHIAAVFLFVQDRVDDTSFKNIEKFFQRYETMRGNDKIFKNVWRNLNFLSKVYKNNELPASRLGWLTSVYLFVSNLREKYGLLGGVSYHEIYEFLESFYTIIYDDDLSKGDYETFYQAIYAATNKKSNIIKRNEILIRYFTKGFNVHVKDEKRLFSSNKIRKKVYNRANGKCQYNDCKKRKIKFNEKWEVHHKKLYATGGSSSYKNGMLVHPDCHKKIHLNCRLKRIK